MKPYKQPLLQLKVYQRPNFISRINIQQINSDAKNVTKAALDWYSKKF